MNIALDYEHERMDIKASTKSFKKLELNSCVLLSIFLHFADSWRSLYNQRIYFGFFTWYKQNYNVFSVYI